MASGAERLLRAYATQLEALRRRRHGGSQTLRVEHVHVNEGGQARIGNVKSIPNTSADALLFNAQGYSTVAVWVCSASSGERARRSLRWARAAPRFDF
jgi:hypothetical protein